MVGAVGLINLEGPIRQQFDVPAAFMNPMMVGGAQGHKIIEVREPVGVPFQNVVGLTPRDWSVTPSPGTSGMHGI